MSLPNFTWNLDPVFYKFNLPLFWTLVVVAVIGALGAVSARRRRDKSGEQMGWVMAVAAAAAAFYFKGQNWEPELRYYSLIFVLVFLGGYALLNWQILRGGGGEEEAGDFIVYGVIGVLAGARLGHVMFYDLDKALKDPVWVLKIWTGGLSSHGAVIGLIIAMWLFTKSRRIPFLEGSDRFAFSAALGATLVRVGNFFNSEIVGRKTDQTWGVRFPRFAEDQGADLVPLRHPSQLYEVTLGLLVLGALYVADRALGKEKRPRGFLISLFFALYFTGRFCIEFVKEYQSQSSDAALTIGQYLSIPGALIGYYGIWWSLKQRLPVAWTPIERDSRDEEEDEDAEEADEDEDVRDEDVDEEFAPKKPARPGKAKPAADERADEEAEARPRKKKHKKKGKKARKAEPEKAEPAEEEDDDDEPAKDD
jgi:phosphatidylglycerol---prolipoprotein diacylglyceryl transferase